MHCACIVSLRYSVIQRVFFYYSTRSEEFQSSHIKRPVTVVILTDGRSKSQLLCDPSLLL